GGGGRGGGAAGVAAGGARGGAAGVAAGGRWWGVGGGEGPSLLVVGCRGGGFAGLASRVGAGSAEWVSHPPIRPPARWAAAMTVPSGARAAQSDLRARAVARLRVIYELARGPGDPLRVCDRVPVRGVAAAGGLRDWGGLGVGEQVPGAGEQLAGDRGGGDLLPAPFGDGLVAGGELRRAL